MAESPSVWYVYGIVPAEVAFVHAPSGLDDAPVEPVVDAGMAAVASRLDGTEYAAETVQRATADMEWVAPRAIAHDRVLTWASDRGAVVPLPMFSLFSSDAAVRSMLRSRSEQLRTALDRAAKGREYALRVYRLDDELRAMASQLSPRLAELERAAAAASPGQRYLLERKLENERNTELRSIGAAITREIVTILRPIAADTVEERLVPRPASGSAENPLVLDAAFLIPADRLESFRRALTTLVERHGSRGFRFDFTGPWPPYHFVQTTAPNDA